MSLVVLFPRWGALLFTLRHGRAQISTKSPKPVTSLSDQINIWGLSPSLLEFTIWIDNLGEVDTQFCLKSCTTLSFPRFHRYFECWWNGIIEKPETERDLKGLNYFYLSHRALYSAVEVWFIPAWNESNQLMGACQFVSTQVSSFHTCVESNCCFGSFFFFREKQKFFYPKTFL